MCSRFLLNTLVFAALTTVGCMYDFDRLRPLPTSDASVFDQGADTSHDVQIAKDISPIDVTDASIDQPTGDVFALDTGPLDTGLRDTGPLDTGPLDTGPRDTGPLDTGPRDTGPLDTGPLDTGPLDTGPRDTGPLDTGPRDTGPLDTGPVDTGPPPCTGPLCPCAPTTPAGWCRVGETCTMGSCTTTSLAGALIITEIQNDPDAVTDAAGEWFEVYNPHTTPVDLRGVTFRDLGTDRFTVSGDSPVLVPARGYAVIAKSQNTMTNGGITAVYAFTSSMNLGNSTSSGDEIIIESGDTLIDRVDWLNTVMSGWPVTPGRSKTLQPTHLSHTDNDSPANWCSGGPRYGNGDYGTPGAPNVCL